jgi:cytidylate kinase
MDSNEVDGMEANRERSGLSVRSSEFEAVLTVDGATGSGKSRLLRELANRYGCETIELGLVVRTVAWLAERERSTAADAVARLAVLSRRGDFRLISSSTAGVTASEVLFHGQSQLDEVLGPRLGLATAAVSSDQDAMAWVHSFVRELARGKRAAISGRRAGVAACPQAGLKIRLEASWATRRARKALQRNDFRLGFAVVDDAAILPGRGSDQISVDTDELEVAEMVEAVSALAEERLGWREGLMPSVCVLNAA